MQLKIPAISRLNRPALILAGALAAVLAFHAVNNYLLIACDQNLSNPDHLNYFAFARGLIDLIVRPLPGDPSILAYLAGSWKPPLFQLSTVPLLLVKSDLRTAVMANVFFLGVSLVSLYGIGRLLFGRVTGFWAALIFSFLPSVFALSRVLYLETALTAMVALTFWLFALNRFDKLRWAVAAGLVMGAGALTKHAYFIFVLPSLAFFALQKDNRRDPVRLRNLGLALLIAAAVAGPWYLAEGPAKTYVNDVLVLPSNPEPWYYLRSIFFQQLGPVFTALFLAGTAVLVRRKQYFLPTAILSLLALFSLSPNKTERFILPLFPFVALVIAVFVSALQRRAAALTAAVGIFAVFQYFCISYLPEPWFKTALLKADNFIYCSGRLDGTGFFSIRNPDRGWKQALRKAADCLRTPGKQVMNLIVISPACYDIGIYLSADGIRYRMMKPPYDDAVPSQPISFEDADFVLVQDRPPRRGPSCWETPLRAEFRRCRDHLAVVREIALPDGTLLHIYKRRA